jgi:anti-sigma regulatory factor (Ser/Thr protein kinase)
VLDDGMGADLQKMVESGPEDEAGRGLSIIRALTDAVEVRRRYPHGAVLHIVKMLRFTRSAMMPGPAEPPNLGFSGTR